MRSLRYQIPQSLHGKTSSAERKGHESLACRAGEPRHSPGHAGCTMCMCVCVCPPPHALHPRGLTVHHGGGQDGGHAGLLRQQLNIRVQCGRVRRLARLRFHRLVVGDGRRLCHHEGTHGLVLPQGTRRPAPQGFIWRWRAGGDTAVSAVTPLPLDPHRAAASLVLCPAVPPFLPSSPFSPGSTQGLLLARAEPQPAWRWRCLPVPERCLAQPCLPRGLPLQCLHPCSQ